MSVRGDALVRARQMAGLQRNSREGTHGFRKAWQRWVGEESCPGIEKRGGSKQSILLHLKLEGER